MEVFAVVHATSCPLWELILPHDWMLKLHGLSLPSRVTLHPMQLGGLAVAGDGTASWGAPAGASPWKPCFGRFQAHGEQLTLSSLLLFLPGLQEIPGNQESLSRRE